MVTLQKIGNVYAENVLSLVGLSTDTKPLNSTGGIDKVPITNGSTYLEMDTSSVYIFDYANDQWLKL